MMERYYDRYYGYYRYRTIDPWQKVYLASQSGLKMSVNGSGNTYDDVVFGTYSCVVSNQHSNESQQIMAVGVYRESCKIYYYINNNVLLLCMKLV